MNNIPDLTNYGYEISQELGRNREGGRITWKGKNLSSNQIVIIKQFCFATTASTWSGYQAYQQEIQLLQQLKHPGIPCYLASVETNDGFCLIQEYKDAPNLSDCRQFNLTEIKQIILEILEIFIYLQQQNPPVLHRDLKPENILVDDRLKVYLIDFGFARLSDEELSASSVFKGTPGFMPPESAIAPSLASDLYSLGVTIVCILTHIKSSQILQLVAMDNPHQLKYQHLLPPLNPRFVRWLEKMLKPKLKQRFANAAAAKAALEPIDLQLPTATTALSFPSVTQIDQPSAIATTALLSLSMITVLGINFAKSRLELTALNIAIAIVAAIVITISQLGAGTLATTDKQENKSAIALAVIIPILVVAVSGLIFGGREAVAIAAAIPPVEIITLSYFWGQKSLLAQSQLKLNIISWFGAIVLGFTLGLKLVL
ncbi:MAG: serine/threonine protein kinase [Pleurocapsa sp.]